MTRIASVTLTVFLVSVAAFVPGAFAYSSPGSPSGYVNDFAQVLSTGAKQSLETELNAFGKATSNEITVVIVPSMGGEYVESYAVKLFAEWGVGKKDKDNGVLLLLSIQERKMRIEVGYGLEGALPDSVAQSILNNEMTPKLKTGDYDGAVTAGVHAIEQSTKGEYKANSEIGTPLSDLGAWVVVLIVIFGWLLHLAAVLARSHSWWAGGIVGAVGSAGIGTLLGFVLGTLLPFIIGFTLLGFLFDYLVSRGYQSAKDRGVKPPWWTGGSIGSGSSGGFGGFGGGGSGGGGASGSW